MEQRCEKIKNLRQFQRIENQQFALQSAP
ncbi:hypothetical protein [Alloscardovia omnicolens]